MIFVSLLCFIVCTLIHCIIIIRHNHVPVLLYSCCIIYIHSDIMKSCYKTWRHNNLSLVKIIGISISGSADKLFIFVTVFSHLEQAEKLQKLQFSYCVQY